MALDIFSIGQDEEEEEKLLSIDDVKNRIKETQELVAQNQEDFERIDTSRKMAYGFEQEPMLTANLGRYASAIYESATSDLTFDEALSQIEYKRQQDIFKEYPEFRGVSEQQEDVAVVAGRVGGAVADPITWVFPWLKVAKAGKLAAAATGAAFTGSEIALRDNLIYGEVNPINLGVATVLGGAGGTLSGYLANRVKAGEVVESRAQKAIEEVAADVNAVERIEIDASVGPKPRVKLLPFQEGEKPRFKLMLSSEEIADIEDAASRVVTAESRMAAIPEATATGTNLTMRHEPIVKMQQVLSDLKSFTVSPSAKRQRNADKMVASLERALKRQQKKENPDRLIIEDIQERLAFFRTEKEAKAVQGTKAYNAALQDRISSIQEKITDLENKFMSGHIKRSTAAVDLAANTLEDLNKNNKMTQGILKALIFEPTRPIIGGIGGYVTAGVVGDEDDTALMGALVAGGAALGYYQKALQNMRLSAVDLETGKMFIGESAESTLNTAAKILTAGTSATKSDAYGGWNKIITNLLIQKPGGATNSVETTYLSDLSSYMGDVAKIFGDSYENTNVVKAVTEVMRGWTDPSQIRAGYRGISGELSKKGLTEADVAEVQRIAPLLAQTNDGIKDSMKSAGIKFTELDNYGLAQLWNYETIAKKGADSFLDDSIRAFTIQYENKLANGLIKNMPTEERILKEASDFVDNVRGIDRYSSTGNYNSYQLFVRPTVEGQPARFRPLAKNFEKHRKLTDTQATAFMAERGWLNLDSKAVSFMYADRAIKMRNFANVFGAEGELINRALSNINDVFLKAGSDKARFGTAYRDNLLNTIEAFWGVHGKTSKLGSMGSYLMPLVTTLANSTMLTRVSISALGDLVQPIQNSGVGPAIKSIMSKVKPGQSFSSKSGFKYDKSFEREYMALMQHGTDPFSSFQSGLNEFNRRFFKYVGLELVTKAARGFAYDVGVRRAFDIAKKGKLTDALQKEINQLGLSADDLKVVSKYKNVNEAFDSEDGLKILDIAGRRSADRDAILPVVGNRLLFTQTGNPYIRSLGQFLSWAQAKTAQTNALVERIENKDVALAVRTVGLVPVYMGVQYLREKSKLSDPRRSEAHDFFSTKHVQESLKLSGNILPFHIDKIVSGLGAPSNKLISANISPSLSYADSFAGQFAKAYKNMEKGDYEGASKNLVEVLPFGKEVSYLTGMKDRPSYAKGGEVLDVPNVPTEPDQRIDKMTGLPYDQQAGTAFVDEEDPLRRLGFGLGSLVTRGVQKVVGALDDDVVEKAIKNTDEIIEEQVRIAKAIEAGEDPGPFVVTKEIDEEDARAAAKMTQEDIAKWQEENALPESQRQKQRPEIVEQLVEVLGGRKTIEEYRDMVDEAFPPTIYTKENAPKFPSLVEVRGGVGKKTTTGGRGIVGADVPVEEGRRVSSRLDIPAYDQRNVWAVTLHEPGTSGKAFAYGQTAILKNVDFTTNPKTALDIALGQGKGTIARIEGNWVNHNPRQTYEKAVDLLDSDEWVQVGMNPFKHSYFYDKATMQPVVRAEEVIQVGPLVLVKKKGIQYASPDDEMFKVDLRGLVDKKSKVPLTTLAKEGKINIDETRFGLFGFGKKDKNIQQTVDDIANDLTINTEGKALKDVMSYVGSKSAEAGKEDYKIIADKVAKQLDNFEKEGFSFNYEITRLKKGSDRELEKPAPTAIANRGAAGVANLSGKDKKISVYINDLNARDSLSNGLNYETILHEGIHAATMSAIKVGNLKSQAGTKLSKDVKDLYSLFNYVIKQFNEKAKTSPESLNEFESKAFKGMNNALNNPDEMVTWGLTNSEMQTYLEGIKYGSTNAWTAFVRKIREILGLSAKEDTALSELLRISDELLSADVKQITSVTEELTGGSSSGKLLSSLKRKKYSKGSITRVGRKVYHDEEGQPYSEKTETIQLDDGRWVNYPTIDKDGNKIPEKLFKKLVESQATKEGVVDFITGEVLPTFKDKEEAIKQAVKRSKSLLEE